MSNPERCVVVVNSLRSPSGPEDQPVRCELNLVNRVPTGRTQRISGPWSSRPTKPGLCSGSTLGLLPIPKSRGLRHRLRFHRDGLQHDLRRRRRNGGRTTFSGLRTMRCRSTSSVIFSAASSSGCGWARTGNPGVRMRPLSGA